MDSKIKLQTSFVKQGLIYERLLRRIYQKDRKLTSGDVYRQALG
jgi:hypothetical protein